MPTISRIAGALAAALVLAPLTACGDVAAPTAPTTAPQFGATRSIARVTIVSEVATVEGKSIVLPVKVVCPVGETATIHARLVTSTGEQSEPATATIPCDTGVREQGLVFYLFDNTFQAYDLASGKTEYTKYDGNHREQRTQEWKTPVKLQPADEDDRTP